MKRKGKDLADLVNDAKTQAKKILQTTDKKENDKMRDELREILFNLGQLYIKRVVYNFYMDLDNYALTKLKRDGIYIDYKKKYDSLENRSLELIMSLKFKD